VRRISAVAQVRRPTRQVGVGRSAGRVFFNLCGRFRVVANRRARPTQSFGCFRYDPKSAMNKLLSSLVILLTSLAACAISIGHPYRTRGMQSLDEDKVYTVNEVDVKANVRNKLEHLPDRKSDCPDTVQVSLRVVLRKSGKVTDIAVIKSSGCSYDQEAIKAVRKLKFDPAVKAGRPVSQFSEIEYETAPAESPNVPQVPDATSLSYGLLLDYSGSMKEDLKYITGAAKTIIEANNPSDETFIVRFISSDKIETLQEFTSDKMKLRSSLNGLQTEGGQTAIIDAVYLGTQHLSQRTLNSKAPRALVLITDGDERASYHKLDVLLTSLHQNQIPVYILAYLNNVKKEQGPKRYEKAMAFINQLAQESRGKVILAENGKDIEAKATDIIRLLHVR
jgi:TonB family protein